MGGGGGGGGRVLVVGIAVSFPEGDHHISKATMSRMNFRLQRSRELSNVFLGGLWYLFCCKWVSSTKPPLSICSSPTSVPHVHYLIGGHYGIRKWIRMTVRASIDRYHPNTPLPSPFSTYSLAPLQFDWDEWITC